MTALIIALSIVSTLLIIFTTSFCQLYKEYLYLKEDHECLENRYNRFEIHI